MRLCASCFKFVSNLEGVQRDIRVVEVGHKNVFQLSYKTFTLTTYLQMVETVDLTPVDHMEVAIGAEKAKPSLRMVFNCLGKNISLSMTILLEAKPNVYI